AKWILISEMGMEEPQAHRYIEKQAMDRGVPRLEVAEEIIRTYT
ncbi:MAG: ANTAR domain-containing protein, partial [Clostridia bacterium]|nr:ANTAR domain-containing protein [Clostridia bacterium]